MLCNQASIQILPERADLLDEHDRDGQYDVGGGMAIAMARSKRCRKWASGSPDSCLEREGAESRHTSGRCRSWV